MGFKLKALFAVTFVIGMAFATTPAFAKQWYFYVENGTDSTIIGLAASEDGEHWGAFDLGAGIAPGTTVKMLWNPSTNDQSCEQMLQALFEDDTESESDVFNFCEDLDDPIVFE